MRPDGRRPDQLRPVEITPGYLKTAEGSVLITVGNTQVLCAASVETSVPHFLRNTGKGWLTAEYRCYPAPHRRGPRAKSRKAVPADAHTKFSASSAAPFAPSWI